MPLPPELDQRIRNRFDELIVEANDLISKMVAHDKATRHKSNSPYPNYGHGAEYQAIVVKVTSLIETVLPDSERGQKVAQDIGNRAYERNWDLTSALRFTIGTLQGLKDDYENGFLDNLEKRIVANISSDYMAQVEEILAAGQSDEYDHIFAAVMCGAILEDALRRLCSRQSDPIATIKDNGQPKRLNSLIAALQQENVFKAVKADQLRTWSRIRNHAAHGEFTEFNRNDVEQMVKGVKNFLAEYL
ncbi:MAG: DUF4145 domain-containing protein [Chloroflexi bacterium]|nr:DUF4145 domain-containing protein [Chloroflexota bacterium]